MQETQPIKSKRITLIQKDGYSVDLEYNDEFAILHLPMVGKFTKDVYLDMSICIEDIKQFLKDLGYLSLYVGIDPTNKLLRKFSERFGFEYRGNDMNIDVLEVEL